MKLDLLTNATVVDDAIRFVCSDKSKDIEKLKRSSYSSSNRNEDDDKKEESNEPDYDEDKDQLKEKQEEQEIGEINLENRKLRFLNPIESIKD